jgi:hypothetical protein
MARAEGRASPELSRPPDGQNAQLRDYWANLLSLRTLSSRQEVPVARFVLNAPPLTVLFNACEMPRTAAYLAQVTAFVEEKLCALPPALRRLIAQSVDPRARVAAELTQARTVLGSALTPKETTNLEALSQRVHVLAAPALVEAVLDGTVDPDPPGFGVAQAELAEEEQPDGLCGLHALALLRSAELTRLNAARQKRGRPPLLAHSIATFRARRQ